MPPKYSISISAYKSTYLNKCIDSILRQDFPDFELIILNDCSPEPIEEIVKSFSDDRIRYYENERNTGAENLVLNWNRCLDLAEGDYFIIMGDDDMLESNYLTEFNRLIAGYPGINVWHCRSAIIDKDGKTVGLTASWPAYETVYENIWHRLSGYRQQFISDFVYRISFLKENAGFYFLPYGWGSDDITAYKAATYGGIAHVNIPLFKYRQSKLTISSSGDAEIKVKALIMADEWLRQFLKDQPEDRHDRIMYKNILDYRYRSLHRNIVSLIATDLSKSSLSRLFRWMRIRSKYDISLSEFVYIVIESIKLRKTRLR
jgi:glycosyltransferase involved in cell wall biosynthesis